MPESNGGLLKAAVEAAGINPQAMTDVQLRRFESIVGDLAVNVASSRTQWMKQLTDPRRDLESECGYPRGTVAVEYYQQLYDRFSIAERVVTLLAKESWQVRPNVYEVEDGETTTPFEQAWKDLAKTVRGEQCWFQDEEGSPVWEYLQRADELSGIGQYGVILLGFDDGAPLSTPLKAVKTKGVGKGKDAQANGQSQAAEVLNRLVANEQPSPYTRKTRNDPDVDAISLVRKGEPVSTITVNTDLDPRRAMAFLGNGNSHHHPTTNRFQAVGDSVHDVNPFSATDLSPSAQPDTRLAADPPESKGPGPALTFLRVFPESLAFISQFESNPLSPRYGQPVMYYVTYNDPRYASSGVGLASESFDVHWTRIIHVADRLESSEVFAAPRMRAPLDHLLALKKVYGASAEGFWRSSFVGYSFESQAVDAEIDKESVKATYDKFINGLDRALFTSGVTVKPLAPMVSDPTPQIAVQIEAICIELGCPVRVFKGSERGELASSQDDSSWNDRLRQRQNGYITPRIIRPFVSRLIALGTLPEPKGYSIHWPDLDSLTDQEKATVLLTRTQAYAAYVSGGVEALIPPQSYMTKFDQFDEAEAEAILADAVEHQAEMHQQELDQQAAAIDAGVVSDPTKPSPDTVAKVSAKPFPPKPSVNVETKDPPITISQEVQTGIDLTPLSVEWWAVVVNEFNPDEPRDAHGKWTGGGAHSSILGTVKAIGAKVSHAEHVASSYVTDRIGQAVGKLPPRSQKIVKAAYALGKLATKAAFVNWTVVQALTERTAIKRGMTEEQARRLRGVLSTIDMKTLEVLKGSALFGLHAAHAPLMAHAMVPLATAGYLAYSTSRNPLATIRAAGSLVADAFMHLIKPKQVRTGPYAAFFQHNAVPVTNADPQEEVADLVASTLEHHDHSDWYVALLSAALEEVGDLHKAIALANGVYHEVPADPSKEQEDDEASVFGDDLVTKERPTDNSFCPTGDGGGIDPTCSPGGVEIHEQTNPEWGPNRIRLVVKHGRGQESHISLLDTGETIQVTSSETHEKFRGKGIGKALYARAVEVARDRGKSAITSDASVTDDAARMWRAMGATAKADKRQYGPEFVLPLFPGDTKTTPGSPVAGGIVSAKVGKAEHVHAANVEKEVANALGFEWEKDNKAYDARLEGSHALEIKSLLKRKENVISVHADALLRKVNHVKANPNEVFHTVVVDERSHYDQGAHADKFSGNRIYYKRGSGRYNVNTMHPIKDFAELRTMMETPDKDLPVAAQGRLPRGKEIAALKKQAEEAHTARLEKDRKRKAAIKAGTYKSPNTTTNALAEGHWVTMDGGQHVYIGDDGHLRLSPSGKIIAHKREASDGKPGSTKPSAGHTSGQHGPGDQRGGGPAGGGPAKAGGPVAAKASATGGTGAGEVGGDRGKPTSPGAAERVPAAINEVNRKLDRYEKLFADRGQHNVSQWLGQLREHISAVGPQAALESLTAGTKDSSPTGAKAGTPGGKEAVQYWGVGTEEANWKNMGHFMESYLSRNGIIAVTGDTSDVKTKMVSALGKPDKFVTGDFKPSEMHFKDKLTEAKTLPGLEKSEDISKVVGKPVTHLTDEVTAKLDKDYGKGQWIVKCYDDNAAAGYGIFFPQRSEAIKNDARNTIWTAGQEVGKHGFKLARDPDSGKVVGLVHETGDAYKFGTRDYERTIHGDVRQWADKAAAQADHEKGAMLPEGSFMVQPAFKAVGISDAERAAGKTWHEKNEGRVHIATKPDGTVEVIPHSTWLKGGQLPVVFEDHDTLAMAAAAKAAIEAIPHAARKGQVYAPDVMKTEGGYKVVELNAQGDYNGSGYLHDNHFTIDSYVSHLTAREPMHVKFIKNLLTTQKKGAEV